MHETIKLLYFDKAGGDQAAYAGPSGATDGGTPQQQQAVGSGARHSLLLRRAQADAAHSLAMRPAENVPVYVMLPLDTVNAEGVFRYAYVPWFAQALQVLALSGVHGVAVDVWWCAIERAPRQYSWTGYKQLFEMVRAVGLKLQVVLSFHACGGNVGDMAQVPLPPWVLQAGLSDPDIFFTDRPRESGLGQRNKEYLSIWADDCPVLPARPPAGSAGSFTGRPAAAAAAAAAVSSGGGAASGMRTPLQCYAEFMAAFSEEFAPHLGTLIEEVVVGSGPCGELRYPSYVEANGWRFPGVGEFQCYDRRALASLAAAAEAAGHPEWGYAGPHNSGGYNSVPLDTEFFKPHGGSWDTDYGDFFLSWYSSCLLQHGERLLQLANQAFAPFRQQSKHDLLPHAQAILQHLQQLLHSSNSSGSSSSSFAGSEWCVAAAAAAAAVAVSSAGTVSATGTPPAAAGAAAAGAVGCHQDIAVEVQAQQALSLLQKLQAISGCGVTSNGSGVACSSDPSSSTASPVVIPASPAAGAAAAGQVSELVQTASSLLQKLLQSSGDTSSSLGLTSAVNGQLSPALAAAVAAAAAAAAGIGSSECINASSASMPTTSSLQSSSSTLDISTSDLLSASQQQLAGLSLNSSKESDLSVCQGGSSSPQQQAAAAGARPGVTQLLQTPVPAAACNGFVGGASSPSAAVDAATAAPAADVHCNGAAAAAAPGVPAAVGSNGLAAASNSCSSDMSCLTTLDSSGTLAAAAAAPAGPVGSNVRSSLSSSTGQLGYPCSSSTVGSPTTVDGVAAAAAAAGGPLMQLFLQLLSNLAPIQQQQAVTQPTRQLQQQLSQLQLQQQRKPLVLSLKIAGVHWWYNSTSHASELTAGYYNTDTRDGYSPILELCERYNVNLTITCVEMCDAQHPSYALCGPEGLLRQIRAMAAHRKVTLSGENALPIFTANGIDATALDRVVSNVRACRMASLRSCSSWPGPGPSGVAGGSYSQQQYQQQQQQYPGGWGAHLQPQQQQQQCPQHSMLHSMGRGGISNSYQYESIQRQNSGGWPPPHQQQQQQRLLQQQHNQQQLLWYGADRTGGHQHTGSHITSNSRNFSELGTLLQVYGSGGSSTAGTPLSGTQCAGVGSGGGVFCGGYWQRSSDSSILGGRSSPNADGSSVSSGGGLQHQHHHQQQQQQQPRGRLAGIKTAAGSSGGSSDSEVLPAMRAFTFLRLGPEILQPECHTSWMRFMHRMLNERA